MYKGLRFWTEVMYFSALVYDQENWQSLHLEIPDMLHFYRPSATFHV
jgi:hypothetical protein